ncbi:MAG: pentapeptide repeat-containing protein [Methyloceanibacter sp.]
MAHQPHRRSSAEGASYRSKLKRIESSVGKGAHPGNPRSHVEIFRQGPAAWNRWRDKNRSIIPDLNGLGLRPGERQMGPEHGGPINLKSTLLHEASLRSACLSAATLERADLSGADLCHGRLNQANLSAANLRNARLDHADLTGAVLNKANLRGARLRSVNLTDADLKEADLSGADLLHARLRGANLAASNLSHARLDHADLADAKLKGANLAGASLYHAKNLTSAQLEEAKGDDSTILSPHLAGTVSWFSARRQIGSTSSKARPKKAALRAAPPPAAAAARTVRDSSLRLFKSRAPWVAAAALWTFVLIGVAMKQSSEAVPLLPPVTPTMPELSLASAAGPALTVAKRAFTRETSGDPARDAETASSRPIVLAALGEPRQAVHPAPSILDEPRDKSPPVEMGLGDTSLRLLMPDLAVEDIRPDTVPAVKEEAPKVRLAFGRQGRHHSPARGSGRYPPRRGTERCADDSRRVASSSEAERLSRHQAHRDFRDFLRHGRPRNQGRCVQHPG